MKPWEKNIRKVVPYVAGEQPNKPNMIKLNTNECPYPPSPKVKEVLSNIDTSKFRLYPDTMSTPLVDELSAFYKVDKDMIFVGVGSDDVLANAFLTFFNSDKPVLFPNITYSFYPVWADLYKIPYKTPKLDENFHIVKEDYYEENGGVIFPNPNAPTSVMESLETIEDIVSKNQNSVVIIDEAYVDFGGVSALPLVEKYENLLIVQTFSKSRSMAGMRIGFAIGNKNLIKAMNDVKFSTNSYTMNYTAIMAGAQAVKDKEYFDTIRAKVVDTREKTKQRLLERGFTFPDSKTNFIFATNKNIDITGMFKFLREKDVYIRHWDTPNIKDYVRITIGTDEEMDVFFKYVDEYIKENS